MSDLIIRKDGFIKCPKRNNSEVLTHTCDTCSDHFSFYDDIDAVCCEYSKRKIPIREKMI